VSLRCDKHQKFHFNIASICGMSPKVAKASKAEVAIAGGFQFA
jgi:hypothetical protein